MEVRVPIVVPREARDWRQGSQSLRESRDAGTGPRLGKVPVKHPNPYLCLLIYV